ncbi:TrkH family potassium uptake protein [Bacillus licheniformis]|jgi:potassium uptake TrkH family protein|uniref:Cation transporter n=3 Tax=Bacillus TaxID=1386 RepID=Q65KK9_BACLD|nr:MULTISPECIES: TrkH family potassium uptake protein [Bacillus]MBJ7885685.1 TrkH family potassium uptake protein [Bacillaceae bacterium HSR45]MDP4080480.1 TrkH family potassium uptake protein [Bacillota bacterium]AAU23050.1 Cation transporter [Bacillus licheniformis DSM 13 = ATCC 14580]AAU40405.1 low affinity potassium transporter integral membrane subunit KtrD [Bacillus licheniformis DSM 13 = ATCC 14580]AKQ72641.1 cation transporter [Bacillus licheniformis WX-02]
MKVLLRKLLRVLSPVQLIALYYFLAVTVSVVLLSLPVAHKNNVEWSFIDALFTAVSAVSVTGLTVVDTADTFSTAGIWILAFVLQFGGIGVMALGTFVWLIFGKRIGLKERRLIMTDQNQSNLSGLVKLMKHVLGLILLIELFGGLILGTYFLKYFETPGEAFMHGFFTSISATTNGGFDITGNSLIPFQHDYFVQFIVMMLIILGAIGFPVLIEVKDFLLSKERKFSFSLFTKLTSVTFFLLVIGGAIGIFAMEARFAFSGKSWHEVFFFSLFQSTTTRSGGLATIDISQFTHTTILFMCMLMFIGASPSSVGGGIRTTTFALNLLALFHFARGNKSVKVFKRELHQADLMKSLIVTLMAVILVFVSTLILTVTEKHSLLELLFEVCSAFGTTGLSMGITPDLSTIGKSVIILLMFIGRIGIVTLLYLFGRKEIEANYHYPKERIIIG